MFHLTQGRALVPLKISLYTFIEWPHKAAALGVYTEHKVIHRYLTTQKPYLWAFQLSQNTSSHEVAKAKSLKPTSYQYVCGDRLWGAPPVWSCHSLTFNSFVKEMASTELLPSHEHSAEKCPNRPSIFTACHGCTTVVATPTKLAKH